MHLAAINTRRMYPPQRTAGIAPRTTRIGAYRSRHLGSSGQVVTSIPGMAIGSTLSTTKAAGAAAGAVGGAAGTALSIAIPVAGAALGIILGGLLSGHYAREKGATNENAALTQVFPAVYQDFQTVISAYNSGQLDGSDAITAINQIYTNYQQAMAQYQSQPGTHNGGCTAAPPSVPAPNVTPTPCNTNCTAGCCIQCNVIASWVQQATAAFTAGSGTIQFGSGGASKYGFPAWSYPSATVQGPAGGATTSSATGLTGNLLTDVTSANVFGIPLWVIAAAIGLYVIA